MKRQDGYYWVAPKQEKLEWFVALWSIVNDGDTESMWLLPGCLQPLSDEEMQRINESRIAEPSE